MGEVYFYLFYFNFSLISLLLLQYEFWVFSTTHCQFRSTDADVLTPAVVIQCVWGALTVSLTWLIGAIVVVVNAFPPLSVTPRAVPQFDGLQDNGLNQCVRAVGSTYRYCQLKWIFIKLLWLLLLYPEFSRVFLFNHWNFNKNPQNSVVCARARDNRSLHVALLTSNNKTFWWNMHYYRFIYFMFTLLNTLTMSGAVWINTVSRYCSWCWFVCRWVKMKREGEFLLY